MRYLKAGLRLVPCVAGLGRKCAHALIKHGVMESLCRLLVADKMASTLKLLSLRAIDSLVNHPQGMERFLGWEGHTPDHTPYQQVLALQLSNPVGFQSVMCMNRKRIC